MWLYHLTKKRIKPSETNQKWYFTSQEGYAKEILKKFFFFFDQQKQIFYR